MTRASRTLGTLVLLALAPFITACASSRVGAAPVAGATAPAPSASRGIPRTADNKPDFSGIWQVRNRAAYGLEEHGASYLLLPGRSVVEGATIPYTAAALAKRNENFAKRAELDPLNQCFMPGVPRIMYLEHPFQIFQTGQHVAMTFEWSQVFRLIYTDGTTHADGIEFWMGDSRGRWEGDTLVVDVKNHNDQTWFDASGNHHSEQLHLVERYTLRDADTINYEVTVEDPKTFTRAWKFALPLYRQKDMDRVLEYQCQAEKEEATGDFEREERTWYKKP